MTLIFQNFINETEDLLKNILKDMAGLSEGADNRDTVGEIFALFIPLKATPVFFPYRTLKLSLTR